MTNPDQQKGARGFARFAETDPRAIVFVKKAKETAEVKEDGVVNDFWTQIETLVNESEK